SRAFPLSLERTALSSILSKKLRSGSEGALPPPAARFASGRLIGRRRLVGRDHRGGFKRFRLCRCLGSRGLLAPAGALAHRLGRRFSLHGFGGGGLCERGLGPRRFGF